MMNDKKKIINVKLTENKFKYSEIFIKLSENINLFYYNVINRTTENLWFHCTIVAFQYIHLIFFFFDTRVS